MNDEGLSLSEHLKSLIEVMGFQGACDLSCHSAHKECLKTLPEYVEDDIDYLEFGNVRFYTNYDDLMIVGKDELVIEDQIGFQEGNSIVIQCICGGKK
jgi:hypothetical protein